jgi:hypothetical protein
MANIGYGIERFSLKQQLPTIWIENSGNHPQEGCFTSAIRSEQSEYAPSLQAKADVIHRFLVGEVLPQVLEFQNRHRCLFD